MNKAYNRCLFTRLPGKKAPVHPVVGCIVHNSPGSHANNIYSPASDKLTKEQLYMSVSCYPGCRVIRAFSDVEKPYLFSDWAVKAANLTVKTENKKDFSTPEKTRISGRVNEFY